jgi:HK97 family phage major capsid protein
VKTSTEYQEAIAELREEMDAIVAVAEREERDLSTEQQKRCSEITDQLIPNLQTHYKTTLSVERERMKMAESRFADQIKEQQAANGVINTGSGGASPQFGPIKIPAKAKNHGPLKAFQGPDAERDAYVAGQVYLAGIFKRPSAQQFCRQHGLNVQNTMVEGTDSAGGFLVPEEVSRTVTRLREVYGVFPRFANRIPMGSDVMTAPRLLEDVEVHWVNEAEEIPDSDLVLGPSELVARKLAALTKVSSELDEDAVVEIGDLITESMAVGMAHKIDDAAFNGDGSAPYGGFTGLANALHEDAILPMSSATLSSITIGDFGQGLGALPQYGGINPRWFMNASFYYATIHNLYSALGGNTNQTVADGIMRPAINGVPVEFVNVMPGANAAAGDIVAYYGDLRLGASYGVRRSFRTQISTERYFEFDVIGIKSTERVGILIHENGSTLRNRPIIALQLPGGGGGGD